MGNDSEVIGERFSDQHEIRGPNLRIFFPSQPERNDNLGKKLENKRNSSINLFKEESLEEGKKIRKKLSLSQEQLTLLKTRFNDHNTITVAEMQELANQTHISARQVDVWFQNRRARTKIKRMEEDCKMLKRRCETLKEENERLNEELMTELRKSKKLKSSPQDRNNVVEDYSQYLINK